MRRRPNDPSTSSSSSPSSSSSGRNVTPIPKFLFFIFSFLASSLFVYVVLTTMRRPTTGLSTFTNPASDGFEEEEGGCCRGMENLELWGPAVKQGSDFKFDSSKECCTACKEMCKGVDGPCLCDSWVFCGDREKCGEKFGEVILRLVNRFKLLGMSSSSLVVSPTSLLSVQADPWGPDLTTHITRTW